MTNLIIFYTQIITRFPLKGNIFLMGESGKRRYHGENSWETMKNRLIARLILLSFLASGFTSPLAAAETVPPAADADSRLRTFLDKVFQTMDDNYYAPVSRETYEEFLSEYPARRLEAINAKTHQAADFMHLGAGLLVNKLKAKTDRFTNFVPSEKSKKFKEQAYAVTADLGLEVRKTAEGFEITRVEKHCEAFEKGVRRGDVILEIDGAPVSGMSEETVRTKLNPAVGTITRFRVRFKKDGKTAEISLESKSYFQETVSVEPVDAPGVLVLKISHFNQVTSGDAGDAIAAYPADKIRHLVIDLRQNGGGPPLAAREMLGFFLPPNDPLFAVARKKKKPVMLAAPAQPISYRGPMTVLVDEKTGSAAETLSGLLQAKGVATLVGHRTAGATYLKSIFDFDDGSLLFMITSLTFFYDRRVFPADGLTPDVTVEDGGDILRSALDRIPRK